MNGDVFLLDLDKGEWLQLPLANPQARAGSAMVVLDGVVFLFGGRATLLPASRPFPDELLFLQYDS